MARAFAKKFYSSKAWQDCRNEYAAYRQHLCEDCLRRGIYKPGVIVHHKIELDPVTINKPEIALNFDNLELLCRDCHARRHEKQFKGWAYVNKRKREKKRAGDRYVVDEFGNVSAKENNDIVVETQKK